jgi:hypothetical protein
MQARPHLRDWRENAVTLLLSLGANAHMRAASSLVIRLPLQPSSARQVAHEMLRVEADAIRSGWTGGAQARARHRFPRFENGRNYAPDVVRRVA